VAQLLDEHPTAAIRVWVIWTPRLLPDGRDQWDPGLMADKRVTHSWDEPATVARDLARATPGYGGPDWDTWMLFGPEAAWRADGPGPLVDSGFPVIDRFDRLTERLRPWL
jgi:hypothetical protein